MMKKKQIFLAISIIVIYTVVIKKYNSRFPTEDFSQIERESVPIEKDNYAIKNTLSLDYPNMFNIIPNSNTISDVKENIKFPTKNLKQIKNIKHNKTPSEIKGIVNTKKMGYTAILTNNNKIEKLKTGDTINAEYVITSIDAQSVNTRSISLKRDTTLFWTK